jgi:hypothetical protein
MTLPTIKEPIKKNGCVLTIEGDKYVMRGRTGKHSLWIDGTSPERLKAHWDGFIRNNSIF